MIESIKLKTPVDSRLGDTLVRFSNISGGLPLKISHGLDDAFSKLTANSGEAIIIILQNKIAFQKPICERSKSWYGRIFNTLTMQQHSGIEIKGIVLLAILNLLMESIEADVDTQKIYIIPFDEAEIIVKKLIKLVQI